MNISFDHLRSLPKHLRHAVSPNASRDWFILLILSGIALTGIIIWNVWIFRTIVDGGAIGTPTLTAAPVFDLSSLDAVHTLFENRAAEELKYKTGVYHYTDPSP